MFDLVLIQYLVEQSKRLQFINLYNLYILAKSPVLWRHLNLTYFRPNPILDQGIWWVIDYASLFMSS